MIGVQLSGSLVSLNSLGPVAPVLVYDGHRNQGIGRGVPLSQRLVDLGNARQWGRVLGSQLAGPGVGLEGLLVALEFITGQAHVTVHGGVFGHLGQRYLVCLQRPLPVPSPGEVQPVAYCLFVSLFVPCQESPHVKESYKPEHRISVDAKRPRGRFRVILWELLASTRARPCLPHDGGAASVGLESCMPGVTAVG